MSRISISAAQRDALHEHILSKLSGIGDVWLAIDTGDFETASRLGREYSDDLRLLLDDLGWEDEAAGPVELSVPPDVLRRIFGRMKAAASCQRVSEQPEWEEMQAFMTRNALVAEACDVVLAELDADVA
jgi:hypothetical protein